MLVGFFGLEALNKKKHSIHFVPRVDPNSFKGKPFRFRGYTLFSRFTNDTFAKMRTLFLFIFRLGV